jgi:two-component system nitrogen regulation sensor histidine kinase NtrY
MPQAVMRREALSDLVGQAVFLQRQAHTNIRFEVIKPEQGLVVECDGRQITQALTNLLQNAVDAITGRIAEPGTVLPRGVIEVSLSTHDGRVLIAVSDNGRGLPVAERDRLTEPYVTTRAKGTGLGLAIVKKIMEDHAGTLEMQDNASGGARVVLCIPLEQSGSEDSVPSRQSIQSRYGA